MFSYFCCKSAPSAANIGMICCLGHTLAGAGPFRGNGISTPRTEASKRILQIRNLASCAYSAVRLVKVLSSTPCNPAAQTGGVRYATTAIEYSLKRCCGAIFKMKTYRGLMIRLPVPTTFVPSRAIITIIGTASPGITAFTARKYSADCNVPKNPPLKGSLLVGSADSSKMFSTSVHKSSFKFNAGCDNSLHKHGMSCRYDSCSAPNWRLSSALRFIFTVMN